MFGVVLFLVTLFAFAFGEDIKIDSKQTDHAPHQDDYDDDLEKDNRDYIPFGPDDDDFYDDPVISYTYSAYYFI